MRQPSSTHTIHATAPAFQACHPALRTASWPARLAKRASAAAVSSQHGGDAPQRQPLRVLLTGASSGACPLCFDFYAPPLFRCRSPQRTPPGLGTAVLAALGHESRNTAVATCLTREPDTHTSRLTASGAAALLAVDLAHADSVAVLTSHLKQHQRPYDVVIHAAGGAPDTGCACSEAAMTRHLLAALAAVPSTSSALLVYVSALGVGSTADCLPGQSVDVLLPWLSQKEASEDAIRSSGHSHAVILRPGPLTSATSASAPASSCILARPDDAASSKVYSPLSRQALGQLIAALAVGYHSRGGRPPEGWGASTVWAVLDPQGVVIASPYMRRLEAWESLPFEAVHPPASVA